MVQLDAPTQTWIGAFEPQPGRPLTGLAGPHRENPAARPARPGCHPATWLDRRTRSGHRPGSPRPPAPTFPQLRPAAADSGLGPWGVLFRTNSLRVWEACVLLVLFGPVVGSVLPLGLGPTRGIFANIAFYLPLTLFRAKFTGHSRDHGISRPRVGILDSLRVLRAVRSNTPWSA